MPAWRCRGCLSMNEPRKRKCAACGRPRPKRRRPAHLRALQLPYEYYVALNGGERCGICGAEPKPGRRHHRDHDHRTGEPRGIACFRCNSALRPYMTAAWLRAAADYLEKATRKEVA